MKNFQRKDHLFSLCGLNCGLCSMHLSGHCPGCGGGEGNQSCQIAKCSIEHGRIEYCNQCEKFPCEKYEKNDYDSFITHRNQMKDFEKVKRIGIEAYQAGQQEKIELLKELLEHYNDGRKKTFFCLAVNLLELSDIKKVITLMKETSELEKSSLKEKASCITEMFQDIAKQKQITLKLRKK